MPPESTVLAALCLIFPPCRKNVMCGRLQRNHSLLDRIKTSQVGPYRNKTKQLLAADEEQVCESLLPALFFFPSIFLSCGKYLLHDWKPEITHS